MAIIAVDMDDVLADTLTKVIDTYNRLFSANIGRADLVGRNFSGLIPPEQYTQLRDAFREHDFFSDLGVLPNAREALETLTREHNVYVVTAAMDFPNSFGPKFAWLGKNFPFIPPSNVVFCGDKSIIHADFLIDDQPRFLRKFRGRGILFDAPHNSTEEGFTRVRDWADLMEARERLLA